MKAYEYKFLRAEIKWGIDYGKNLETTETEWNQLVNKDGNFVLLKMAL